MVVFVLDAADDGLQKVLHRDYAGGAAVFVEHDGYVLTAVLQLAKHLGRGVRIRHEVDRAQYRSDVEVLRRVLRDELEQILDVKHADNIVYRVLVNGDARIAFFYRYPDRFVDAVLNGDGLDFGAVGHYLVDADVVELEDVVDHLFFRLLDDARLLALLDHDADLLLGHFLGVEVRIDPEEAEHAVRRLCQQPDEGREYL